jgi:AcrR family transcriptional regulator
MTTATNAGMRRTRADIAAETRKAILVAACEVIAEVGFEKIRMRMVAERAGVSTAALHYHFDTRENLFAEALRFSFDYTGADVYEARGRDDSAIDRLARIVSASLPVTASLRQEWAMWQELWCRAARDQESRSLAVELYRAHTGWIKDTLADGIASGEFQHCDTASHAQLISSLCDGFGVQLMIGNPSVSVESARATIWAIAVAPLGLDLAFPSNGRRG